MATTKWGWNASTEFPEFTQEQIQHYQKMFKQLSIVERLCQYRWGLAYGVVIGLRRVGLSTEMGNLSGFYTVVSSGIRVVF